MRESKTNGSLKAHDAALVPIREELLNGLEVVLEAKLGSSAMTVAELMGLKTGSVVTLDRSLADHVDIYLNGMVVARGEIAAVGDQFAVRIVSLAGE